MGDLALHFTLPAGVSRRALLEALRAAPAIVDAVIAEHVGVVTFADPARRDEAEEAVRSSLARGASGAGAAPPRRHRVEVVYDGEDLDEVGRQVGLGRARVIELHAAAEYEVAMLGFLPGFAYLRGLPEPLVLPRRASPRPRVPPGSLAMAAEYTGIYPFASPGGWHLLGRARPGDAFSAGSGARLALGDAVSFVPVEALGEEASSAREHARAAPDLVVQKALGPALVVDGGRAGRMHEGVPAGGPLVRPALAAANVAVGNGAAAPALEVHGRLELVARSAVRLADDAGRVAALAPGDAFEVAPGGRSRCVYLAVEGGLDVPRVLGGAGTLLVAGLGGLEGRPLRKGDVLAVRSAPRSEDVVAGVMWRPASAATLAAEEEIVVIPGPDLDATALEALAAAPFRVSATSDRTGTRLEGPPLPAEPTGTRRASTPMVEGAIERTPSGLIVLGPDHPTTGGYPVVGVVAARSRAAFFARPVFAPVRFRIASP